MQIGGSNPGVITILGVISRHKRLNHPGGLYGEFELGWDTKGIFFWGFTFYILFFSDFM